MESKDKKVFSAWMTVPVDVTIPISLDDFREQEVRIRAAQAARYRSESWDDGIVASETPVGDSEDADAPPLQRDADTKVFHTQ